MKNLKFVPGQAVWIIVRDDLGDAFEVAGFQYLAQCSNAVIVGPYVGESDDLGEALLCHMDDTKYDMQTCLLVYPADDCYGDEDNAQNAFSSEAGVEYDACSLETLACNPKAHQRGSLGDNRYKDLIAVMQQLLSENEMEILNDALQCYGRHPKEHSYDDEIDIIRNMALAFNEHGYNYVLPEYDILRMERK